MERVQSVLGYLPAHIQKPLANAAKTMQIREIRLYANRPLVVNDGRNHIISENGPASCIEGIIISRSQLNDTVAIMCRNSIYAMQEQMKNGFITLPGGHRVGICGKVITADGEVSAISDFSSINIRIARQVKGAAEKLMHAILQNGRIKNTLVISPPGAGKTTLLRDIARLLGSRFRVGIVDERSEIAACVNGIPQNDVGTFTDVLDACPKKDGMLLLLRAMGPQCLITDEIGTAQDVEALHQALNCGVSVICSVHGDNLIQVMKRPSLQSLFNGNAFQCAITLKNMGEVSEVATL